MTTARPATPGDTPTRRLAVLLVVVGVLVQISYPLTSGTVLQVVTVTSVLLLATAGLLHAAGRWGARYSLLLLAAAGSIGLLAETVGVHTGYPFGEYTYSGRLGPRLAGVPVLVPIAWTMTAYPALLLGRRLAAENNNRTPTRTRTALLGGFTLAAWDLYLDPQMIAQGAWRFTDPYPALPGVPGIPLSNYAGWLLVALVMIAVLDRVLPVDSPRSRAPDQEWPAAAVLAWIWLGSAVGNLVFFGRPWVALYGGVGMGLTVFPYLRGLATSGSGQALRARIRHRRPVPISASLTGRSASARPPSTRPPAATSAGRQHGSVGDSDETG